MFFLTLALKIFVLQIPTDSDLGIKNSINMHLRLEISPSQHEYLILNRH